MNRFTRVFAVLGTACIMGVGTSGAALAHPPGNAAGPPTTTHNVKPVLSGKHVKACPKGTTTFINTFNMKPGDKSASYSNGGTTFQTTVTKEGKLLSFTTNSPSFTVYIAGARDTDHSWKWWDFGDHTGWFGADDRDDFEGINVYDYTGTPGHPNFAADAGLHAPLKADHKLARISYYIVCGQPAKARLKTPRLSTVPSPGGTVGVVVLNDKAVLSGANNPHGFLIFNLYAPRQECGSGAPVVSVTESVAGNGTYRTTGLRTPANMAGTWSWLVIYTGDSRNKGVVSPCSKETVAVIKASPSLTTTPSAGGTVNTVVLNDTAALAGGFAPGGTVTFNLYSPSQTCGTGTPAYTKTVPVAGNGSYSTSNTVPASATGTWSWTATYSGDSNNKTVLSGCGLETVKVTAVVPQGSCEGTGSVATLVSGTNVVSYVPKGSWGSTQTGIDVVNVEGTSVTSTLIPTGTDVINSCASNSVTGQTVCTANNTHVYVLKGMGLDPGVTTNPMTDGGSGTTGFSGGMATTTGVAMDAVNNRALLAMSVGTTGGYQFLNLATGTFGTPFATSDPGGQISEDPLLDPVRNIIGSANEDNNFEIADITNATAPKFYEQDMKGNVGSGAELDSTSEDCSTGILLAPGEFSDPSQVVVADIQNAGTAPKAVFTPGTPGTWTAPEQVQTLTGSSLAAGSSGSAVAQGTHTGVISGEFGGDGLTALALPTTSGAGATPAISNWVTCHIGGGFSMGDDPHTLAAYKSPNGGDAIAILVNQGATTMARVDLTAMLNSGTVPATGNVCDSGTLPASVVSSIPLP